VIRRVMAVPVAAMTRAPGSGEAEKASKSLLFLKKRSKKTFSVIHGCRAASGREATPEKSFFASFFFKKRRLLLSFM